MDTCEMLGGAETCRSGLTEEQLERQRILAMRSWEMRPLQRSRPCTVYRSRRADDKKALLRHGMGALVALGALILISTF